MKPFLLIKMQDNSLRMYTNSKSESEISFWLFNSIKNLEKFYTVPLGNIKMIEIKLCSVKLALITHRKLKDS